MKMNLGSVVTFSLVILAFCLGFGSSSLVVVDPPDDTVYITTKYSNQIGGFSSDCHIPEATVVKLHSSESLCHIDSITVTNVSGNIIFITLAAILPCVPEKLYQNAIDLGAIGLINADVEPPGGLLNYHTIFAPIRKGDIPFLDLGFEFFVNYGILGPSEFTVNITGCGDHSYLEFCTRTISTAGGIVLGLLCFFGFYLSWKGYKELPPGKGTKPRRFILAVEGFYLAFSGAGWFFGFVFSGQNAWFVNNRLSYEVKSIASAVFVCLSTSNTLVCALYWNELRRRCFLQTTTYHFFRWQFRAAILFGIGFASSYIYLLLNLNTQFEKLLKLLKFSMFINGFVAVIFLVTTILFISRADEFLRRRLLNSSTTKNSKVVEVQLSSNFDFGNQRSLLETVIFRVKSIPKTLRMLIDNSLAARLDDFSSDDRFSRATMALTIHLSRWLMIFVFLVCIQIFDNLTLQKKFTKQFVAQDDPKVCRDQVFLLLGGLCLILLSMCKIIGISGPSKKYSSKKKTGKSKDVKNNDDTTGTDNTASQNKDSHQRATATSIDLASDRSKIKSDLENSL